MFIMYLKHTKILQGLATVIGSPMTTICGLGLLLFLKIYQNHYTGLQLFLELPPGTPILKCLVRSLNFHYYVPKPKGAAYFFWCRSRRRPRCFVSVRYLLNRWTDFDQTCTDTLLGGRNKLIRFW